MRIANLYAILILTSVCYSMRAQVEPPKKIQGTKKIMKKQPAEKMVEKKVLSNGMTVLVRVVRQIPKVSIQLWYNVGSKDEKDRERGIAHLIEHMIFKGTAIELPEEMKEQLGLQLSESDLNTIAHMFSTEINAFTGYDYTGYKFNTPTHHWQEWFPIMADCMQHVAFKEDHLNSEMKAVIQELKMNKDKFVRVAVQDLIATIFPDHPYHHPVIGYKQDLWNVHANDLRAFYKKHYVPNNATLVVVGDVNPQEVFDLAQQNFGSIPANPAYKKEQFYFNQDITSKGVTLYRNINQPQALTMYVLPGIKHKDSHILDVITLVLGSGKASRLYRKIVDELHLATSFATGSWGLFDYCLFFFMYEPRSTQDIPTIQAIINEELEKITHEGISEQELVRAVKQAKMNYFRMLENSEQQANEIGLYYVATGDENYAYNYLNEPIEELQQKAQEVIRDYFRPSVAHTAQILPLPEQEKTLWNTLQEASDKEDQAILSARVRTSPVEAPSYAKKVQIKQQGVFTYPKAESFVACNGLKVFYAHNGATPKIDLLLEFKAKNFYDPEDKQGLFNFVAQMLIEGTKKYNAAQLADELESRGMSFNASPAGISMSMLSSDLEKGLELLQEILTNATFDPLEMEKVRQQILTEITMFWDDQRSITGQLIKEEIYKNHPYHKNALGTKESVGSITRQDLVDFYERYISPHGSKMAIVGDIKHYDLKKIINTYLGAWTGPEVAGMDFPALASSKPHEVDYPINRDQIFLAFAGLSVDRKHKDFDKLLIFDQIFGGGVLGSMYSRLFALREQSGLFYTINGSLTSRANEQPGMVIVQTLVSLDRLTEAERVIKETINHAADTVSQEEFAQAVNAIVNSLVDNFESNANIAQSFLFLDRYNFPADYFDTRAQQLKQVSKEDMQRAVKNYLNTNKLVTFKVGRIEGNKNKDSKK